MNLNLRLEILELNVRKNGAWLHIVALGIVMLMRMATGMHLTSRTVVMVWNGLVQHHPAKDK